MGDPADYLDLFKPNAPWPVASAHLQAFEISAQMALTGTDEQLKTVIEGLRSRHIGLAIQLGLLTFSERCGGQVEGYAGPLAVDAAARRIKSVGGQIDYVEIDEPVVWGHLASGKAKFCQDSISDLVDQIAPKVILLKKYFPNVQFGEIDTIDSRHPKMVDDLVGFADLFRKKTGVGLTFFHADMQWNTDWRQLFPDLVHRMHASGIRIGVVCDGDTKLGSTNETWVASALDHCKAARLIS